MPMLNHRPLTALPVLPALVIGLLAVRCPPARAEEEPAPGAPANDAQPAQPWAWESFTFKNDLWLALHQGAAKQFDFRIGAGGALAEMRDSAGEILPLLSPTNKGEVTDRVVQWVAWSETVTHRVEKLPKPEWRFNVNQAGTNENILSPTVAVRWSRAANLVDVYSVPQDQWQPEQRQHMKGNLSSMVRYEGAADGVLKIRRVVRVGEVTLAGKPAPPGRMIIESWTPFRHSAKTFDSMALSLGADGRPDWWYQIGRNLPRYPNWPVQETKGYAAVFHAKDADQHDAVGVVYGASPMQVNHQPAPDGDEFDLNSMGWDDGIGVLPGLYLNDVKAGTVVDQWLYLVPRHHMDAALGAQLAALAKEIPPPQLYPPDTKFEGDLAKIVEELTANVSAKGTRTEHLAKMAEGEHNE